VFVVVYFVINSVWKLLNTPSYLVILKIWHSDDLPTEFNDNHFIASKVTRQGHTHTHTHTQEYKLKHYSLDQE